MVSHNNLIKYPLFLRMSAAAAEEEIDDGLDASMAANEDDEEVSGNNVLEVPLDEDANETIEIDLDVTDVEVRIILRKNTNRNIYSLNTVRLVVGLS